MNMQGRVNPAASSPPLKGNNTTVTANGKAGWRGPPKRDEGESASAQTLVRSDLSPAGKRRIVELWATFHSLSQIRDIMRAETGSRISDGVLCYYNVGHPNSRASPRLKLLFAETRKRYVEEAKDVAIAHQAHRLRQLERVVELATKSKDYNAALKGIELAAKEMGGLTQTVRHEGIVGMVHKHTHSIEDAKAEVAMRLTQLLEGGLLHTTPPTTLPTTPDTVPPLLEGQVVDPIPTDPPTSDT